MGSLHRDDKILARMPELIRIGDDKRQLLAGIGVEPIRRGGMTRQNLHLLGIQLDFLLVTVVDFREIILVVVASQHLSRFVEDALLLELALGAKDIVGHVQLLVLVVDGLRLL